MNEREWARDLTQAEFDREFEKRYPGYDVIPDVKIWTANLESKKTDFNNFNVEIKDLKAIKKIDGRSNYSKRKKIEFGDNSKCEGCGKSFIHFLPYAKHIKTCDLYMTFKEKQDKQKKDE